VADCPYNSDNDEHEKKNKKEKKEKKEKKMIFKKKKKKKKKGGSYVVTWDSDASSDDDSSDDDKASKKKALASIAINNKPSLFDTPSCFMAKSHKVQYDESESKNEHDSDSDNENEFTNEQLMDMLEQADSLIHSKNKKCKELAKKLKALEQFFDELNATHERLVDAH